MFSEDIEHLNPKGNNRKNLEAIPRNKKPGQNMTGHLLCWLNKIILSRA